MGSNMGVVKTWFCLGIVFKIEIRGVPATQMDCMVPRRPWGELVSLPTNPTKKWFYKDFLKSEKNGALGPLVGPLLTL